MADDTTGPGTSAGTGDTTTPTDSTDLAAELARWKTEARKHEARAKAGAAAVEKLAKLEDANKSELERAQTVAAEAQARIQAAEDRVAKALTRAAISAVAAKAGAIDIDAVLALMPADAVTLDGDDVKGVDEAIKAMREAKPYLFGKSKPAAGSADGGQQGAKAPQWSREDLKGKSPAEINAARAAGLLASLMST